MIVVDFLPCILADESKKKMCPTINDLLLLTLCVLPGGVYFEKRLQATVR